MHTARLYRYRRVCFSPPSGQRWGTDPQVSQKRRDAALGMQSVGTGAGRASQRAFPAPLTPRSSHGRVPALRTSPCDRAQNRTLYGRAQNRTAPQSARTAPSHRTAPFRGGPGAGRGRPAPPPDLIDSAAVHWERRGRGLRTAGGSRRGRGAGRRCGGSAPSVPPTSASDAVGRRHKTGGVTFGAAPPTPRRGCPGAPSGIRAGGTAQLLVLVS